MLLLIGLANSANFAFAGQPGLESSPHGFERMLNFLKLTFVDARAYPVFAIMFGYGLVQLARRQQAAGAGTGAVRRILVKRNAWLIAFGLVALFGLLVARITRLTLPVRAVSALGQRSLSGYLFQSVSWMVLLAPFTLNLRFGSTAYTAAVVAIGVWVVSVVAAYAMSRRSYRGPAETRCAGSCTDLGRWPS